jgi:hypothetical protein
MRAHQGIGSVEEFALLRSDRINFPVEAEGVQFAVRVFGEKEQAKFAHFLIHLLASSNYCKHRIISSCGVLRRPPRKSAILALSDKSGYKIGLQFLKRRRGGSSRQPRRVDLMDSFARKFLQKGLIRLGDLILGCVAPAGYLEGILWNGRKPIDIFLYSVISVLTEITEYE